MWGPLAGWFARRSDIALTVSPIEDTQDFAPLMFRFDIAIGVRKGDHALRDRLNAVIARQQPAITELLQSYGVPLAGNAKQPAMPASAPAQ